MHDQLDDSALEMLSPYNTYLYQSSIIRKSSLSKLFSMDEKYILPKNSMLHMMSNLSAGDNLIDGIHVEEYPLLQERSSIKYLKHMRDIRILGSDYRKLFPSRVYKANLITSLNDFNKANRKRLIPVKKFGKLIDNSASVLIANYNPLFRVMTNSTNELHHWYRFTTLFSAMLGEVNRHVRNHFLVFHVPDDVSYSYQELTVINNSGKVSKSRLASADYFYFLFLSLGLYLEDNSNPLSVFRRLNNNTLRYTNLLFVRGSKSISVNLATLIELCDGRNSTKKFLDSICDLSKVSSTSILEPTLLGSQETKLGLKEPGRTIVLDEGEDIKIPMNQVVSNLFEEGHEIEDIEGSYLPKSQQAKKPKDRPTDTESLNKDIEVFIDEQKVTPKQKERAKKLSEGYANIKLADGSTMKEVMDRKVNTSIEPKVYAKLKDVIPDERMLEATTEEFDKQYMEKQFQKDVVGGLLSFQKNGLFITAFEEEDESNEFTRVRHTKVSFEDINGKKHTVRFKYPLPDDEGYLLVDGIKLSMTKQMVNVPICKISPTRVSLISNYNKTLVEKVSSTANSLTSYIGKNVDKLDIKVVSIEQDFVGVTAPYEYKAFGKIYASLTTKDAKLVFDYHHRYDLLKVEEKKLVKLEEKYGLLVGKLLRKTNHLMFMDQNNRVTVINMENKAIADFPNRIIHYFSSDFKLPYEWCNLKILDKNIPVIFVLAYRFGLSEILRYLRVKYRFIPNGGKREITTSELIFKFKDGTLIIDRYPLVSSLIIAGFKHYSSIKQYNFDNFDDKDTYYQLLTDKGMSTNYLKGIDNHFTFFIDHITRDVLLEMDEPTNTKDLLIRAVEMLVYNEDKEPASLDNFRVRSFEKIPATIYNEISRQYANYSNSEYKDGTFSINTESVYQRIIQDQTVALKEEINPIHAIKEKTKVTYTGFGGRTAESFVERDRKFPKDGKGILSEATVDSGSVAMNAYLSPNAGINNVRGTFSQPDELDATNSLSTVAQLMPFGTNDDAKRLNFSSIIMSHHVPSEDASPDRVRTGYELTIAQKTSSKFVLRANDSGKIVDINEKDHLVKVDYKDGSSEVFEYGDVIGDSAGSHYSHTIALADGIKKGKSLKEGDIIGYHTGFFTFDEAIGEPVWNHGVSANIAIMNKDVVLEDSCAITSELADKLKFDSVYERLVKVSTDMVVKDSVKIGDKVSYNSLLLKLGYDSTASLPDDVDELFEDLQFVEYRAKNEGEVVDIQVFYASDEMSDSIKDYIKSATKTSRRLERYSKDSKSADKYKPVNKVEVNARVHGIDMNEMDVVIIFFIKTKIPAVAADKVCISTQLKSVIGKVITDPITTESGVKVDCIFGALAVFNRVVLSAFKAGILNRVLEESEDEVVSEYFS